ncbi:hypothetical protein EV426DRAFT_711803 [Tirmania nivea]|nr:hypothetical protein EV426DRAFT_711803 [Tirmania nivea]
MEIMDAIKTRISNDKYVWAIWGVVSKLRGDEGKLEDVEFIILDEDLVNFLEVVKGIYKPTMLQVKDGKGYVRAWAAARAAGKYNHKHDNKKAAEVIVITIFSKLEVGDFNNFDLT